MSAAAEFIRGRAGAVTRATGTGSMGALLGLALSWACGGSNTPPGGADARPGAGDAAVDATSSQTVELDLLYVHGLKNCLEDRMNAADSFLDLEAAINEELALRIPEYEAAHPGVRVVTRSARANLYTAESSGVQPSDSPDPVDMDDWEVGAAGCTSTRQGDPCTTAYEWRYRLAREIERLFPPDAHNIILIGHSTGVRVAFEVAAGVGPDGVGTEDWGVKDRIAGVVGIHGMVDALGNEQRYDMAGPFGFETTCKLGQLLDSIGGPCAPGPGWCEYGARLSAYDAADFVAQTGHALTLVSHHTCSPSAFSGETDGSLPLTAQASPMASGLVMTPAPGQTVQPAFGVQYGSFCHSAIDTRSNELHDAAVLAARDQIVSWLFENAPEVERFGSVELADVAYQGTTPLYDMGGACRPGRADAHLEVTGKCLHPGLFDGDDHAIDPAELTIEDGADCTGRFAWSQLHDAGSARDAVIYWKTYATPAGAGVLDRLPRD